MTRPVIASTARTTHDNWRPVVADICGAKTAKSAIITCMGNCPFKVILLIYLHNFRTFAQFIQQFFWRRYCYKNTYYLQIEPGAGQLAYYFYDTDNPGYHISDGKLTVKEWTHVAIAWDGNEARFYINGEHDGKVIPQKGAGRSSPDKVLRFGGENNACCPRFFVGIMDELMLANYALSAAEIQRVVKDTLDVSAKGKVTTTWGNLKK